jgi:drug/metabolite transporter (DMT)-like permease
MIYTQMIWSLVVDFAFFHVTITKGPIIGAVIIIGCLSFVTVSGSLNVLQSSKESDNWDDLV